MCSTSAAPTGWSSVEFDIGDLHENFVETFQICLKSGRNMIHFTRRPKYVLLLPAILNGYKIVLRVKWYQAVRIAEEA
jgi:hypothetical protein